MGQSPLRGGALVRATLAAVLVLGVTACGGDNKPPVALPSTLPGPSPAATESPVVATGLPDGVDLEVADSMPGTATGENLTFVSQIFTLEPSGPLDELVAVSVELDNAQPADAHIVVATRGAVTQPWTYAAGKLASDNQHVEYTTRSLGDVAILSVGLDQVVASFQSEVEQDLVDGAVVGVRRPACADRTAARAEGYSVVSTTSSTLFYCFGLEGDKHIVTVANRRPTPVEVSHVGATVITAPEVGKPNRLLSDFLGASNTLMTAGKVATFGVELEPEKELTLNVVPNPKAQSLRLLQAAVRAVSLRVKSLGLGAVDVPKTMTALLARPPCAKALETGGLNLLTRCLAPARLVQLLGPRGVLLQPLVTAPTVRTLFTTQGKALAAAQKAQRQRIVVRRVAPDFKGIFGTWLGISRQLTISRTGFVLENYGRGVDPVIDLSYQLGYPLEANGVTTVEATIVKVKVNNRKLLNGRMPKVGDTGTLKLRKGVITPPFLSTKYCDRANRKKGICGPTRPTG